MRTDEIASYSRLYTQKFKINPLEETQIDNFLTFAKKVRGEGTPAKTKILDSFFLFLFSSYLNGGRRNLAKAMLKQEGLMDVDHISDLVQQGRRVSIFHYILYPTAPNPLPEIDWELLDICVKRTRIHYSQDIFYEALLWFIENEKTNDALQLANRTNFKFPSYNNIKLEDVIYKAIYHKNHSVLAYLLQKGDFKQNKYPLKAPFELATSRCDIRSINLISPHLFNSFTQKYISTICGILLPMKQDDVPSFKQLHDFLEATKKFLELAEAEHSEAFKKNPVQCLLGKVKTMIENSSSEQLEIVQVMMQCNSFIQPVLNSPLFLNSTLDFLFKRICELNHRPELQHCYLSLLFEIAENKSQKIEEIVTEWKAESFFGNTEKTNQEILEEADRYGITQSGFFCFFPRKIDTNKIALEKLINLSTTEEIQHANPLEVRRYSPVGGEKKSPEPTPILRSGDSAAKSGGHKKHVGFSSEFSPKSPIDDGTQVIDITSITPHT